MSQPDHVCPIGGYCEFCDDGKLPKGYGKPIVSKSRVAPAQAAPAQPIRKSWVEVGMLPKDQHEEWIRVVCPSCRYEASRLALKSSIAPDYLFTCERNTEDAPEIARNHTLCSARWSIARVEAEAPRGDQVQECSEKLTEGKQSHQSVNRLEARGDQPIDIEGARLAAAEIRDLLSSKFVKAPQFTVSSDLLDEMIAQTILRHMQSKTQPNREGK